VKRRDLGHPTALLATSHELLFECVPELRGHAGVIARAVLPGPYTLVLPNPARRFRWLTGTRPDTIGVRIPELPESTRRVVETIGCVAATSANEAGGPDPAAPEEVPEEILVACGAVIREGRLPGTPSTVIDFTGRKPVVLREGAAPAGEAIARANAALGR
jgi:L-threonylcarbamoyladenylate synthase